MQVIRIKPNEYLTIMTADEEFNLRVIIETSNVQFVRDIPELIGYQMSYLAEMAFTTIKEPGQNG